MKTMPISQALSFTAKSNNDNLHPSSFAYAMRPVDLSQVRTIPLQSRANKVAMEKFARPAAPGRSFAEFLETLPGILAGEQFRIVVSRIAAARKRGKPVIVSIGGHVVKCGLGPLLIDLMRRGIITTLAMNGSGAIHDFELALLGETSEDVAAGLENGAFGMVRETGEQMNQAINRVLTQPEAGMGQLLGDALLATEAPCREVSLLAAARQLEIPLTVHVAIGTDIIHMHPSANGAATGLASFNDFRLFTGRDTGVERGRVSQHRFGCHHAGSVSQGVYHCAESRGAFTGLLHRKHGHDRPLPPKRKHRAPPAHCRGRRLHAARTA